MDFRNELVLIGKIVNTFSMKGTLKLLLDDGISFNQDKINDSQNKILFFQDNKKVYQPLEITKVVNDERNLLLINFEGYKDINKAETLKNFLVFASKENSAFEKEPDYLEFTVDYSMNNQQESSPVIEWMSNGQYLLFKIQVQDKEIWIPQVDEYISEIDIANKKINAKNIERLII